MVEILAQTTDPSTLPYVTAPDLEFTPTVFGFLAVCACAGITLGFMWHGIIFVWSPLKWYRMFRGR